MSGRDDEVEMGILEGAQQEAAVEAGEIGADEIVHEWQKSKYYAHTNERPVPNWALGFPAWAQGLWHYLQNPVLARLEFLNGITISLAMIPEAVAFAFVASLSPQVGLFGAFWMLLITSIFGGRTGMVSGADGAMAVVMSEFVPTEGPEYLFLVLILCGLIQMFLGVIKIHRFLKLVSFPVVIGFVNGLAVIIFLAQIENFKEGKLGGVRTFVTGWPLAFMFLHIAIVMFVMQFFPKITEKIPSTFIGIIISAVLEHSIGLGTPTVGDIASISGSFPTFAMPLPDITFLEFFPALRRAFVLCAVGLVESLITLQLVDDNTETEGEPRRETFAQGLGNIVSGFFGAMGGCTMIGQSVILLSAYKKKRNDKGVVPPPKPVTRLATLSAALFLLLIILVIGSTIELLPVASLIGVMFMVVLNTFDWDSVRHFRSMPKTDVATIVLVIAVTVYYDLAVGVFAGVAYSSLAFSWNSNSIVRAKRHLTVDDNGNQVANYTMHGVLCFSSARTFYEIFADYANDADTIVLDMSDCRVADSTAVDVIRTVSGKYADCQKKMVLLYLNDESDEVLHKTGNSFLDADTLVHPEHDDHHKIRAITLNSVAHHISADVLPLHAAYRTAGIQDLTERELKRISSTVGGPCAVVNDESSPETSAAPSPLVEVEVLSPDELSGTDSV